MNAAKTQRSLANFLEGNQGTLGVRNETTEVKVTYATPSHTLRSTINDRED